MNQILDIVGSYIIGGVVLLMILGMIYFFNNRRQETVYSQLDQYSIMEVGNIIEDDLNKIGYGMSSSDGDKLVSIDSTSIIFRGDLDLNKVIDTVQYSLIQQGSNKYLQRRDYNGKVTVWTFPVKSFNLIFHTSSGGATLNKLLTKSILVKIETEDSNVDKSISQNNVGASWQREFYPQNF